MKNSSKFHILFVFWFLASAVSFMPVLKAQFTIEPGGFVTLKEGGSLMIGTNFHIKSISSSSGYFADQTTDGDVTITGDISVERYMAADMWHNAASPVSNETTSCFTGTDLVFYYDETLILNDWSFGWVWNTTGPLTVFRGYDIYFDASPVTVDYSATGSETLNTGAYNIAVTNTLSDPGEIDSHKGWNLVGNPYPSPVDWLATGWDKSDINDAKYIWDGVNDIYTIFIGGGSPIGINGGTQYIPSNQGFWVQAVQTGSFGIQNSVRLGSMTGTPDYYKINPVDYPMISLVASGNNRSDETVFRFIGETTDGFDLNYDALKLFSSAETVPQVSIHASDLDFALNTLPEVIDNLEVRVNFQCGKAGYYRICLSEKTCLDPAIRVYLKDEREQKFIDMTSDSVYLFYHKTSYNKDRFKVYLNPSSDILGNITPESYFSVYSYKNMITFVKNTIQHISGQIAIYNMLGQPLWEGPLSDDDRFSIRVDIPAGHYVVSIMTDQYVSNQKILITK